MILCKNPSPQKINELFKQSKHNAAKWLKDSATGDIYYWPAEMEQHAIAAKMLHISKYTKGLAVPS